MKRFDVKSALLGLAAGVAVMICLGATADRNGPVGRFQIAGTQSHAFVVDTATGQVWRGYFQNNGGNTDTLFFKPKLEAK